MYTLAHTKHTKAHKNDFNLLVVTFLGDSCNAFDIFGGLRLPRSFLTWACLFIDSIGLYFILEKSPYLRMINLQLQLFILFILHFLIFVCHYPRPIKLPKFEPSSSSFGENIRFLVQGPRKKASKCFLKSQILSG